LPLHFIISMKQRVDLRKLEDTVTFSHSFSYPVFAPQNILHFISLNFTHCALLAHKNSSLKYFHTHFHQLGIKDFPHVPSVIDDVISWNAFVNTYQFTTNWWMRMFWHLLSQWFQKTVGLAKPVYICVHIMILYRKSYPPKAKKKTNQPNMEATRLSTYPIKWIFDTCELAYPYWISRPVLI